MTKIIILLPFTVITFQFFRIVILAKIYKAFLKMQLLEEANIFILLMTMHMISSSIIDKSRQESKSIVNEGNI